MKNLIGHRAKRSIKVQDRKTAAIEPRVFYNEFDTFITLGERAKRVSKEKKWKELQPYSCETPKK